MIIFFPFSDNRNNIYRNINKICFCFFVLFFWNYLASRYLKGRVGARIKEWFWINSQLLLTNTFDDIPFVSMDHFCFLLFPIMANIELTGCRYGRYSVGSYTSTAAFSSRSINRFAFNYLRVIINCLMFRTIE